VRDCITPTATERAVSVYKVVKQFESGVRAHCTGVIL